MKQTESVPEVFLTHWERAARRWLESGLDDAWETMLRAERALARHDRVLAHRGGAS